MILSKARPWLAPGLIVVMTVIPPAPAPFQSAGLQAAAADTATADALAPLDAYRLGLLKLKGHLGVARSLLQLGEPGADYHLQQPFERIFRNLESELAERDAPLTADVLEQLERATEAAPQAALTTLDSAASAIDGSFAQPGPLGRESALAISEALLRAAVDLYARSVEDNEVTDLRRYQSGRGFAIQAEALVRHSTGLKGQAGQEALLASIVLIRQAWPGVIPPPIVFDPQSVARRLEEAVAAMKQLQ